MENITQSITGANLGSDWSTELPKCQPVNVAQNTQASVNMVEIAKAMEGINRTKIATGGTNFHSQKNTNFCHSYGIVSGLRNALIHVAGNKKSKEVENMGLTEVSGNKTATEVLTDASPYFPVCEFPRMLAGFINNVNPRSFEGLDGDGIRKSKLEKQTAILTTVITRLTSKTMFETNGWKRIYSVLRLFEAFELNPENYELEAEKVTHPIAVGNRSFQEEIMADKNAGKIQTGMTKCFFETHQKTFKVNKKYLEKTVLNF